MQGIWSTCNSDVSNCPAGRSKCTCLVSHNNNTCRASTARTTQWLTISATAASSFADRGVGFGVPGITVDGDDFFAVYEAAGEVIRRAREGGGPALLECKTNRFFGHFEGDAQTYRAPGELDDIRAHHDCIKIFRQRVLEAGALAAAELDGVDSEVAALIEHSVAEARAAAEPGAADLLTDVYVRY